MRSWSKTESEVKECKEGGGMRGRRRGGRIMPWQVQWASERQAVYTGAERWRDEQLGSGPTWKKPLEAPDWFAPVQWGNDNAEVAGQEPPIRFSWLDWLCLNPAANKNGVRVKGWRFRIITGWLDDRLSCILQHKSQRYEWHCCILPRGLNKCFLQHLSMNYNITCSSIVYPATCIVWQHSSGNLHIVLCKNLLLF